MLITQLRAIDIDDGRWSDYRARVTTLPQSYRAVVEAIEQYLLAFGRAEGDEAARMFEDLADLFEQCAALTAPVTTIVGSDPAAFVEEFLSNYRGDTLLRAQQLLTHALADACTTAALQSSR
ncbi:DUF1048 domain-containing protein [Leifsonia sp. 2TAF2]|uniref:DUF1048 domain-containing protein n=1 Tax=Leifsonia sp. 2TAF2 TaxID=3233009 RepID=UPI003F9D805D